MKLKLTLSKSELTTLSTQLVLYVQGQQADIRQYPGEYLVVSVLYDLQQRVAKKVDTIRLFERTDADMVNVSIPRNEAIALYCYVNDLFPSDGDTLPALHNASFEANLLQRLASKIHQTYMV